MAGREPLPHTPLNAALLLMFFMVLVSLRIQPGLTGWWQVMGRHGTTFEQRLRMDEEHQQLAAVDGLLYPDENSLGGLARERGVDKN